MCALSMQYTKASQKNFGELTEVENTIIGLAKILLGQQGGKHTRYVDVKIHCTISKIHMSAVMGNE